MERECLALLLRGTQPVVVCPARGVGGMRVPPEWRAGLEAGRLLVASPFPTTQRRVTAALTEARNRFVVAQAARVFIAHAAPGSRTETLAHQVLGEGKPLLTLDDAANGNLLVAGAQPV